MCNNYVVGREFKSVPHKPVSMLKKAACWFLTGAMIGPAIKFIYNHTLAPQPAYAGIHFKGDASYGISGYEQTTSINGKEDKARINKNELGVEIEIGYKGGVYFHGDVDHINGDLSSKTINSKTKITNTYTGLGFEMLLNKEDFVFFVNIGAFNQLRDFETNLCLPGEGFIPDIEGSNTKTGNLSGKYLRGRIITGEGVEPWFEISGGYETAKGTIKSETEFKNFPDTSEDIDTEIKKKYVEIQFLPWEIDRGLLNGHLGLTGELGQEVFKEKTEIGKTTTTNSYKKIGAIYKKCPNGLYLEVGSVFTNTNVDTDLADIKVTNTPKLYGKLGWRMEF
jgi:hypothetical protein